MTNNNYNEYNRIRLNIIINHFSKDWFEFKNILLVGFDDTYIINRLTELKANIIKDYNNINFDLIISINSLNYNNWQNELNNFYLSNCSNLVLETEVIDFGNDSEEDVVYSEYQNIKSDDNIISTELIETIFKDNDFNFKRYKDKLLNNVTKTNRFWICTKNK